MSDSGKKSNTTAFGLSPEHVEAANRQRRIIFQDDVYCNRSFFVTESASSELLRNILDYHMGILDEEPNQIDSVWCEWGRGNTAVWPSKILPRTRNGFPKWWEAGIDPVNALLQEVRKRGREVFFSYRISEGNAGLLSDEQLDPIQAQHPEWVWDFTGQQLRELKARILHEVAEMYDFDGIQIDFARSAVFFPAGAQWENRDLLTEFMRQVRLMLLEVERARGRPLVLAARVPENIMGCHFDGMDVERWAREKLVDILVLGVRSVDVDVAAFRGITAGTGIKLYPSWTDHHSSDGYELAPVEVYRGVYANWWGQGADGVHTFNLMYPSPPTARRTGVVTLLSPEEFPRWETQCQIFREIGSPETLKDQDKVLFVQRRGGGYAGDAYVPNPRRWFTPRHMYFNSNMFAPLPTTLASDGKADTLLTLAVADDMNAAADRIKEITLRLAISDAAAENLPDSERLEAPAEDSLPPHVGYKLRSMPPAKGVENLIEVRINNLLLGPARVATGWLVFPVQPRQLAVGDNLVGVRVTERPPDVRDQISIEKLELHLKYW